MPRELTLALPEALAALDCFEQAEVQALQWETLDGFPDGLIGAGFTVDGVSGVYEARKTSRSRRRAKRYATRASHLRAKASDAHGVLLLDGDAWSQPAATSKQVAVERRQASHDSTRGGNWMGARGHWTAKSVLALVRYPGRIDAAPAAPRLRPPARSSQAYNRAAEATCAPSAVGHLNDDLALELRADCVFERSEFVRRVEFHNGDRHVEVDVIDERSTRHAS